jgi:hypothetical protein
VSPVHFLVIALVIAAIGILVAVSRHRQPVKPESAMDAFRREMQALAPRDETTSRNGRTKQPSGEGAARPETKIDEAPGIGSGEDEG